ncbi:MULTISPECIES: hypothetical protein [Bacillus]|uniref:Uncharacterized protein n=1 Tax=Bacillus pseudomycoides TaxID=64104 RepID=A0A1Y3MD11_9BACI|nr:MULTISPECIES: hypothetical protein [Bacillus cereus group]EOP61146.1 hypothetical protein IIW_04840 [Bacillus cereus VD136]EOP76259.1 hypothetical protein KOW_04581 [Bacillus cereus VDM006]EOQ15925.1 hypothetical protein KOY_03709 [Bacillus cereus VDM021]OOG90178.1 hypothetical protein BTH41_03782 [Bacillus mycoides]MDF2085264.1 hypothetical protein [Bacillus pseudomycoides]
MRIVKDERLMIQGLKHTRMAFVLQNLVILCMVFYRYVIKGVGYGLKLNGSIFRLTSMIDRNTIVFESDEQLKGKNFKLFSLNHSPESG